ncbi:hypothetical protein OC845_006944 [Tilletia horrida]|nr:hypothetical protein OC845_006944 [Tilletia horrida]
MAQSSFILLPHNYLTSDPSRRTHQQVRVSYGEWQNHSTKLNTFGQEAISYGQTYPLSEAVGNLLDYQGDIAVRKFPYAQHPYNDTQSIV